MEESKLKNQEKGKEEIWTFQVICSCMSAAEAKGLPYPGWGEALQGKRTGEQV